MLRFKKEINVFRCYVFLGSEANIHRTNDAFFKSCQASNRTNVYSCRIKGKVVLFYDFVVRSIFACNIPIFKLITLLYEPLTIANRQDVLNRIVFITLRNLLAENGGYPPTQNGDIRSLFWLFSLMALQN